ncbi:MAG: Mrp/NBP35 family ATP-binding protein [Clostridiales bacterium]|nr:Mrp/NBP35 family ATP-binding protein [Clostridiales bacterium]
MSNCSHDCSSCSQSCGDRKDDAPKFDKPHELSRIKRVIAVVSGKGGVGKSSVTSLLAATMNKKGYKCAILDADITGASIPKMFGVSGELAGDQNGIYPAETSKGIRIISSNLLLENETDPIVWRGPVIAGMVKQFWTDVIWGDVDYMFIDCPPGTGDVPLTVFQSIKVDGIVIVTTPQELVSMIVEKAVNMANLMKIPVLGIVENMSYVLCPHCNDKITLFGDGEATARVAQKFGLPLLAQIPYDKNLVQAADSGKLDETTVDYANAAVDILESGLPVSKH